MGFGTTRRSALRVGIQGKREARIVVVRMLHSPKSVCIVLQAKHKHYYYGIDKYTWWWYSFIHSSIILNSDSFQSPSEWDSPPWA